MKKNLFIVMGVMLWGSAQADIPYQSCFAEHAARYGVDERLLITIARQESGIRQDRRNDNSNGSFDVGVMQINSSNFERLEKLGLSKKQITQDACTNIRAGAIILSENIQQLGSSWRAVGAYNALSEDKRIAYAWKIYRQYQAEYQL